MSAGENSLTPIASVSERKAAFDELVAQTSFVTGLSMGATEGATILLRALRIEELRQILFFDVIEESTLLPSGTIYHFSFHIDSGQFQFEAVLKRDGATPSVELNKISLQRLQRRNNFRTSTGKLVVSFKPRKPLASGAPVPEWRVLDVSVGGFAFAVSGDDAKNLKLGQHLEGTLTLSGRADLKLKAVVRHIDTMEAGTQQTIGLEVLDMDQAMQRDLLSLGLQIHRETKSKP